MSLIEWVRAAREGLLRAASPFEAAWQRLAGRRPLPPLWLRRHTGPIREFRQAAADMAGWIDRLTPLEAGAVVFDLGCGCGAMVEALRARLGGGGRYVGFDVHGPSIAWCRDHLANANTTFELARVDSPYADPPQPAAPPGPFPLPERAADFVLAKSVFTHLLERDTRHNLAEIARVLKPEGRALVSVFLFEPETETPVFKWQAPGSPARFRFKERPEAAVAWPRATFFSWIEAGRP